jgi:hypothetical protein
VGTKVSARVAAGPVRAAGSKVGLHAQDRPFGQGRLRRLDWVGSCRSTKLFKIDGFSREAPGHSQRLRNIGNHGFIVLSG